MLIVAITALSAVDSAGAQSEETKNSKEFPSSGTVIVISPEATAQIKDEDPRPVATATVLEYSRTNADWLWIDSLWGWIDRSEVLLIDDAEDHYTKIIKAAEAADQPVGVALHQRGIARLSMEKPSKALEDFDAAIEDNYKSANVYINRAQALASLKKYDQAVESVTEAIAIDPKNGLAYDARAIILSEQDYLDAALTDADRAVELAPDEPRVWYDRGLLQQRNGQFPKAVDNYNKAVELSPRFVEAVANRGFCLKRLKRFAEAKKDYETAIEINPGLAVAHNDLAWLLATCSKKSVRNPKVALTHAEKAVSMTKREDGQFLDTLAAAHALAGDWDKAVATAREAVKLLDGADQYSADQRLTNYLNKKPFIDE